MSNAAASEKPPVLRERTFQWGDPALILEAARGLSGLELVRKIFQGELPKPPSLDLIDFRLAKVEAGAVDFEFDPAEFHYNPMSTVHGGVISTLLDSAMSISVLTSLPAGVGFSTLELKVNFVRAASARTGTMRAVGHVVYGGTRTATAEAKLLDKDGKLYAHSTTTCLILS